MRLSLLLNFELMWRNACEKLKCSTKVKYCFNHKMSIIAKTWCVCPDTASVELS